MNKFFAAAAVVSLMALPALAETISADQAASVGQDAAMHGGGGHVGGGFGGGHVGGGNIGHGPVGGGYNRGPIGGGRVEIGRGGFGRGEGRVYPGYNRGSYYGSWSDRRWVRGGYYYGSVFYPVVGFTFYNCSAVNAMGQVYNYSGDIYDAQAGALNTCQMYSGYGACQIVNCAIY